MTGAKRALSEKGGAFPTFYGDTMISPWWLLKYANTSAEGEVLFLAPHVTMLTLILAPFSPLLTP